jgi:hypothetical protein
MFVAFLCINGALKKDTHTSRPQVYLNTTFDDAQAAAIADVWQSQCTAA